MLAQLIIDQISNLKPILGDLMLTVEIVTTINTGIDKTTNTANPILNQKYYDAIIDQFDETELNEWGVTVNDIKLCVITNGDQISTNTVANIPSGRYNVIKTKPVYVGSIAVINTLLLRK